MSETVMMKLGDYEFSLATAAYDKLSRTKGYRWQSAARIGRTPAQHYTGPDAMTMQLSGLILSVLPDGADGVTALSFERRRLQLEQMRDEAGKGTPLPMVDGTGRNWGRWVITNVNEDQQSFFADGSPREISFSMSLTEYGDDQGGPVSAAQER